MPSVIPPEKSNPDQWIVFFCDIIKICMSQRFVRIYKKLDIHELTRHLLIYGDLSAQCANCRAMDLKPEVPSCPKCHTEFQYIAFRNVRNHLPKLQKVSGERPEVLFVDYDDYKRNLGELKAREFLR